LLGKPVIAIPKLRFILFTKNIQIIVVIQLIGGIQRAGTGKNKKVTEISPLLAFWPEGLGINFFF